MAHPSQALDVRFEDSVVSLYVAHACAAFSSFSDNPQKEESAWDKERRHR